jgi:uncharacterized protein (DUF302 family)
MLNKLRLGVFVSVFFFATHPAAGGPASPLPNSSVKETVNSIVERLETQGLEIVLVLNHAANAAGAGLKLRPTTVIFARLPAHLERRLLRRGITLGLDLPLKFLVFEDAEGSVQIRHNPIGYLIDRHDLRLRDRSLDLTGQLSEQFGETDVGIAQVQSPFNEDSTVSNLESAIGENPDFRIPLKLQLDTKSSSACTLLVFGNPKAGTPLMQETQEIGIDLPQKFLVCARGPYQSTIYYNNPLFIAQRHNLQGQAKPLQGIAGALAGFAARAAGTL